MGEVGEPGPSGDQGQQGSQGMSGTKGARGRPGRFGPPGNDVSEKYPDSNIYIYMHELTTRRYRSKVLI